MHDPKEFLKREISSKVVIPPSPQQYIRDTFNFTLPTQDLCKKKNQQNTKQFLKSSTLNYKNSAKKGFQPRNGMYFISSQWALQGEDLQ